MSQEPIKLTEDGGVIKEILQEGQGTETPANGYQIQVTYIGTLTDGTEFDSNTDKENPFEFQVGVGQVIKGWDLGMVTMKKGERALFTLSSEYAYGASGSPPKIPANATLKFEVEMLDWFRNKGDHPESERYQFAAELKVKGNQQFKSGQYQEAVNSYDEAHQWLNTMYDQEEAIKQMNVLKNNMAMTHLKLKNYDHAISATTEILLKEPSNEKALFRRAQGNIGIKNYSDAKSDLMLLYNQDKQNAAVVRELQNLKKIIAEQKANEKQSIQRMFAKGLYDDMPDAPKSVANPSNPNNTRVFMDIKLGQAEPERVEFELYDNVVPKTTKNFAGLIEDKYKDAIFHRNIAGFMIQGGDYENRNGTGGKSIYGKKFDDENFNIKHTKRGQLSMANAGPNTNGSQFFVLYKDASNLDGKHVVFGEVSKNIEFLDKLEAAPTGEQDKPQDEIVIVDCGLVSKE